MKTREALLASLRARLDRFVKDQDTAAVLSGEAIGEVRALLAGVPDPSSDLEVLRVAGHLYWFRYQVLPPGKDQQDLRAALMFLTPVYFADPDRVPGPVRAFLESAPPGRRGPGEMAERLAQRAAEFAETGHPGALDDAIDLLRQAVAATPGSHPDLARYLFALDDALERRFELTGVLADVDEAVRVSRQAVAAVPPGSTDHASALSNLGNALGMRFDRTHDLADLDEAIEVGQKAMARSAPSHPARAQIMGNLGANLLSRYTHNGRAVDLDQAVDILRQAADLLPHDHPGRPFVVSNLGNALEARFGLTDDPADLDQAIEVSREAVGALPSGHPRLRGLQSNLATALQTRFKRTRQRADVDEAIELCRRAAAATPVGHSMREAILGNLGNALSSRFESAGDLADLDEAVEIQRQLLAVTSDSDSDRADRHAVLGQLLLERFNRSDRPGDLDEAIEMGRQAAASGRADLLVNLGATLQTRYGRTEIAADLDEAIESYRRAAGMAPGERPVQAAASSGLSRALIARYERTGDAGDLQGAVEARRRTTAAGPTGGPQVDSPDALSDHGSALGRTFERSGIDPEERSRYQRGLRAKLKTRIEMWRRTGNPEWLAEDQARDEAFTLVMSAASKPKDAETAREATEFLTVRTTALDGVQRGSALAELVSVLAFLQDNEVEVRALAPDPGLAPKQRRDATPLSDIAALMVFFNQFLHTPNPRATGELALSRLDEYDETFFTGIDALIFHDRLLGETNHAERLEELKEYIEFVKHTTAQYGVQEFRDDLAWGQAMDDIQQLAEVRDDRPEMDEKLNTLHEVIQRTPRDSPRRVQRLSELATVLRQRFQRSGLLDDLDECIRVQREAVEASPQGSIDRAGMLANLGLMLKTRFEHRRAEAGSKDAADMADLDEAIEVGHASIQLTPAEHPLRPNRLGAHATLLLERFKQTVTAADIDEAIASLEEALNAETVSDKERRKLRGLLDWAHTLRAPEAEEAPLRDPRLALRERLERFEQSGAGQGRELLDSDEACDELLAALAGFANPPDLESDLRLLADTINFLRLRFAHVQSEHSSTETVICQMIAHHMEEIQKASAAEERTKLIGASPEVARNALTRLRELWGRLEPATFAADPGVHYRALLEALGEPWPPSGLDERISRLRGVLERAPQRASYLNFLHEELGIALWERFNREGSHQDIVDAIGHLDRAIEVADRRGSGYIRNVAPIVQNLGTAFLALGERTHDVETLNNAINAFRQALRFFAPGTYDRTLSLSNLGMALQFRYSLTGAPDDITEAVTVLREAVEDTSDLDPDRPARMTNLCMALGSSFQVTHDAGELNEAIEVGQTALATLPLSSVHRARLLANVGVCFEGQFKENGSKQDRAEAIRYFEEAARTETSPVWDRIRPARGWGLLAADSGDYAVAVTAFGYVVELLPMLAWHGLEMADRLSYLGSEGLSGLALEAAACAIADGRPDRAMQLLEHGRGVLLSQVLNLRTDLSMLATGHADLAEELGTIRKRLDGPGETDHEERRDLAQRWDRLVKETRRLPDFGDFLLPPRLETLLPAAAAGPIVVVNVSTRRCDALLVTENQVRLKELPRLSSETVTEQANRYLSVLQEAERTAAEAFSAREEANVRGTSEAIRRYAEAQRARVIAHRAMEQTLPEVMAWLWDVIAEPVLDTLGFTSPPAPGRPWPRLWWCPTGPLSLLPLHAAAHPEADGRQGGRAVLDRVVSSYTPTLRALTEARQGPQDAESQDRMLVVALPDTPGQPPLHHVTDERDLLTTLFPRDRHTLLQGKEATRTRVSRELPSHRYAHFSCHGDQNLTQPLQGGLLLYDGMLTFADVITGHYHGEYAFLSACKTATGGLKLADEVVTIASALHYTGYRHVIASSWSVLGSKAANLAKAVYADLTSDGAFTPELAAWALHRAVRQLRDTHPDQPSVWMPFTHTGP